jgi:lysozyme family protein
MQVNSGGNAIKILQRVLNRYSESGLSVDGVIGPNTLRAADIVYKELGADLVNEYGIARRDYYYGLADNRPSSRKYAKRRDGGKGGWIKRAEEFLPQELQLTEDQHRERTSAWG